MPALWPTAERMPRFAFLLAGMLLELMLAPLLRASEDGWLAAHALGAFVLLGALSAVGLHRVTVVLFIAALAAQAAAICVSTPPFLAASVALRLLFLCHVVALLVWRVLRDPNVTLDTIAGAACAYLGLGMVWGDLYLLVEYCRPGSFDIPSGFAAGPGGDLRAALIYFSFVTLTTVGYGEVHPANPAVGGLCAAEALVGQLYLAIMIARMVGLHIVERAK